MSHNLYYNDLTDRYSFFSVKEKPWHGLGQVVEDYCSSQDVIKHAGLDYLVEKQRLFACGTLNNGANDRIDMPGSKVENYFATVRTDTKDVLGVVGKDYGIVQNKEAFSFFDSIFDTEGVRYETAGALGKGERIFVTAKLPEYIKIGKDDLIEKYLFLTTSHDGYGSILAAFTPVRIVCNNTLNSALRNCSNNIRIRHTSSAKEKLKNAQELMGLSSKMSAQLEELFNRWAKIVITDKNVRKLIELAMMPRTEVLQGSGVKSSEGLSISFKATCDEVFRYAMNNPTQQTETTKGTLYGAYNSITGYFQNIKNYKNQEGKLKSVLLGGSAQTKCQRAFNLCEAFSKNGEELFLLN